MIYTEEYKWTSYHANAYGDESWITPHEEYLRLGHDPMERCFMYRELFRNQINSDDIHKLRKAAHYCQPCGNSIFTQHICERYGIIVGKMASGRPKIVEDTKIG